MGGGGGGRFFSFFFCWDKVEDQHFDKPGQWYFLHLVHHQKHPQIELGPEWEEYELMLKILYLFWEVQSHFLMTVILSSYIT